ncbi:MAG TPA: UvrD-helicase domain-containing protein [Gemmatimonadaceae bacterium]|nr:UvrD-helicase domain-containing protein [Gemmatimonadaceae bacterium]
MRSIEYARAKGREARETIDGAPGADLLARLETHLDRVYRVNPAPLSAAHMHGSRAEVNSDEGVLKYDASLRDEERLMLFAHELGHLVLHGRVRLSDKRSDPRASSAYGETGPAAIARYSPRTYEETQAVAFALEFVAPSEMVWRAWCETPTATAASLAAHFQCTTDAIRAQLAHALHATALGGTEPSASRKDVPFTEAQLSAARWVGAPAIVDAGPGTGKTATVVRRIQFLLEERGAHPHEILALTFSNEAAQEMSERIATAFGADVADAVNVRTFHGFGVEFLHLHGHHVGLNDQFELLDEDRQIELVLSLLGKVRCYSIINLRVPLETATRAVECINRCKQRLTGIDAFAGAHEEALQIAEIFRAYEAEKGRADAGVGAGRLCRSDCVADSNSRRASRGSGDIRGALPVGDRRRVSGRDARDVAAASRALRAGEPAVDGRRCAAVDLPIRGGGPGERDGVRDGLRECADVRARRQLSVVAGDRRRGQPARGAIGEC